MGKRWVFFVSSIFLILVGGSHASPCVVPPGETTLPLNCPAGVYTSPGVTLTPKPVDPPPTPLPTGSIYLKVYREGKQDWHQDNPYWVGFQTTGPTTLVVSATAQGMGSMVPTDITVRYLLDGVAISPPLSTAPFRYVWDATTLAGAHAIWLEVTGPGMARYSPLASHVYGSVVTGPQRLPILPISYSKKLTPTSIDPGIYGYINYDPILTMPKPHPWNSRAVRSDEIADRTIPLALNNMIVEPATHAPIQGYGNGVPAVQARGSFQPEGQPAVRAWHDQAGDWSEFSYPKVELGPHIDGPRGVATESNYTTCVGLPSAGASHWRCVNAGGRVYELLNGRITTIYGRLQTTDAGPITHVGTGAVLKGPQDLSVFPGLDGLTWIANTFDHTIERLDCRVQPCTLRTEGGQRGVTGQQNGVASTFNRPYSIITHGPHTCPGREEFQDCYHHYVADLRNNAIRNTKLYRPMANEMPEWETLVTGLTTPMVIRWDKDWNIIIGETTTGAVKRWNWTTRTIQTIAVMPFNADLSSEKWYWLAVDRLGSCGPVDDVWVAVKTSSGYIYRMAIDGTRKQTLPGGGSGGPMPHGPMGNTTDPAGHYRWEGDFHSTLAWPDVPQICAYKTSGFGSTGTRIIRPKVASDTFPAFNEICATRGYEVLNRLRPKMRLLGVAGYTRLGFAAWPEWAELADAPFKAILRTYDPGMSDADANGAMYRVRMHSHRYFVDGGKFACGVDPGPMPPQ